jgi:hypothetical protein
LGHKTKISGSELEMKTNFTTKKDLSALTPVDFGSVLACRAIPHTWPGHQSRRQ